MPLRTSVKAKLAPTKRSRGTNTILSWVHELSGTEHLSDIDWESRTAQLRKILQTGGFDHDTIEGPVSTLLTDVSQIPRLQMFGAHRLQTRNPMASIDYLTPRFRKDGAEIETGITSRLSVNTEEEAWALLRKRAYAEFGAHAWDSEPKAYHDHHRRAAKHLIEGTKIEGRTSGPLWIMQSFKIVDRYDQAKDAVDVVIDSVKGLSYYLREEKGEANEFLSLSEEACPGVSKSMNTARTLNKFEEIIHPRSDPLVLPAKFYNDLYSMSSRPNINMPDFQPWVEHVLSDTKLWDKTVESAFQTLASKKQLVKQTFYLSAFSDRQDILYRNVRDRIRSTTADAEEVLEEEADLGHTFGPRTRGEANQYNSHRKRVKQALVGGYLPDPYDTLDEGNMDKQDWINRAKKNMDRARECHGPEVASEILTKLTEQGFPAQVQKKESRLYKMMSFLTQTFPLPSKTLSSASFDG